MSPPLKPFLQLTVILLCGCFSALGGTWVDVGSGGNWTCAASSWNGKQFVIADASGIYNNVRIVDGGQISNVQALASSATGKRLVAVCGGRDYSGPIYTSTNAGGSWQLTAAPVTNWLKVTSSPDGERLVSVAYPSTVFMSTNGGQIWNLIRSNVGGDFRRTSDLASSADGSTLAISIDNSPYGGQVYVSHDGGQTWWDRLYLPGGMDTVACTADGNSMIAAGWINPETPAPLFISTNSGLSWTSQSPKSGGWKKTACSADGQVFVGYDGRYVISTNAGTSWFTNYGPTNFITRSIALSPAGNRMLAFGWGLAIWESGTIPLIQVTNLNISVSNSEVLVSWPMDSELFTLSYRSGSSTNFQDIKLYPDNSKTKNYPRLRNDGTNFTAMLPIVFIQTNSSCFFRIR